MLKTIYFNLFILLGVLSPEIIGSLTEENNGESEFHIRRKRVIAHKKERFSIDIAPYIVQITLNNKRHCMGSILSPYLVLTTAHCVENDIRMYQVLSGSGTINAGLHHNITEKIIHENFQQFSYVNDIALVKVAPLIPASLNTQPIKFYENNLRPNTLGSVFGWSSDIEFTGRKTEDQHQMQRIVVPIVNTTICAITYLHSFEITEKNLCTFDNTHTRNRCGHGDFGSPLVVKGKLVGMYIWSGLVNHKTAPDVFLNLKHPYYIEWIRSQLRPILDTQLRNHAERNDQHYNRH